MRELSRYTEPRFMICSIEGEGAPDAGGGASSAPTPETSAPSGDPSRFGGSSPPDAVHNFKGSAPTADDTTKVRAVLDKGKDPDHSLGFEDIRSLLGFNPPFKPQAEPAEPAVAPAAAVTPTPKVEPTPVVPPVAPAPALSPDTQALVQALREALPPAPASASSEPQAPKPYYGGIKPAMQVAPEITNAIFNAESPQQASQAMNALVVGMMNKIMEDVVTDQTSLARYILGQVPSMVSAQSQASNAFSGFFTDYPELDREALKPTIKSFAEALAVQRQKSGQPLWDASFRQVLGEAVHTYVERQLGTSLARKGATAVAPSAPAVASKIASAPKPAANSSVGQPWMSPGGSRPPAVSGGSIKSAALLDLIR